MDDEEKIREILKRLNEIYEIRVFHDRDPYRVLVRTILSQRTKDENTDKATNALFEVFPDIHAVANAPIEEVEQLVRQAGFYRVKSRRIIEVSQILIDQYGGEVPNDMDELLSLPGVGRKTANCVLVYAFEKAAIPVDTHVHRVPNRMGLVNTKNPEETERELLKFVPEEEQMLLNDLMVQFGKTICKPITPQCEICPLTDLCKYKK